MEDGVKMNKVTLERQLLLSDINGENIAQFLIMSNGETQWVLGFMYYGMHEMMRQDISNPILIMDGMQMSDLSFLGWISTVARNTKGIYRYRLSGIYGTSERLSLEPVMSAKVIAALTGFELEKVKAFYEEWFTVDTQNG
jgi:hypothetical protein